MFVFLYWSSLSLNGCILWVKILKRVLIFLLYDTLSFCFGIGSDVANLNEISYDSLFVFPTRIM
jgi:hypothetical protein